MSERPGSVSSPEYKAEQHERNVRASRLIALGEAGGFLNPPDLTPDPEAMQLALEQILKMDADTAPRVSLYTAQNLARQALRPASQRPPRGGSDE